MAAIRAYVRRWASGIFSSNIVRYFIIHFFLARRGDIRLKLPGYYEITSDLTPVIDCAQGGKVRIRVIEGEEVPAVGEKAVPKTEVVFSGHGTSIVDLVHPAGGVRQWELNRTEAAITVTKESFCVAAQIGKRSASLIAVVDGKGKRGLRSGKRIFKRREDARP